MLGPNTLHTSLIPTAADSHRPQISLIQARSRTKNKPIRTRDQMTNKPSSSIKRSPAAAPTAVLMLFNAERALAFQSSFLVPSARMMHGSPTFSNTIAPATVTMDCAPWDVKCYGEGAFGSSRGAEGGRRAGRRSDGRGGGGRDLQRRRRFRPMIFPPPEIFEHQQPQMRDPAVIVDTDQLYALSFDLPVGANRDGLDVSISDRLLTVKAHITHEDHTRPSTSRGGWLTRSSRTDSVSRSFILPEGVSESSASVSLSADGNKAEVKFNKDRTKSGVAGAAAPVPAASSAGAPAATAAGTTTATADSPVSSTTPVANRAPPTASSSVADSTASSSTSSHADAAKAAAQRSPSSPESAFEMLDQEFREFARAMWGQEVLPDLKVPTQKEWAQQAAAAQEAWAKRESELADRAKAANEAREKRVTAMRRATMAADMSQAEDGSSYFVKIALPEGTTRENVKLSVNPDRSLRATASASTAEGAPERSVYKDVFLPKDALLSNVSARFEAEQLQGADRRDADGTSKSNAGAGAVSGLDVTIGRAAPPQPQSIDIL